MFIVAKDRKSIVNTNHITSILQEEQKRLDTLKSQVSIQQVESNGITLEELGFTCELASDKDREYIKNKVLQTMTKNRKVYSNKKPVKTPGWRF